MSNNGIPPLNDWQEDNYPVIYDEGATQLKYVKTGNKVDVPSGGSSYLVYTALLSQSGTDAPVATVLENTLGGTVVWGRAGVGDYNATLAGAFPINKTVMPPFSGDGYEFIPLVGVTTTDYAYQIVRASNDVVNLATYNNAIDLVEWSSLGNFNLFIEIRVYP